MSTAVSLTERYEGMVAAAAVNVVVVVLSGDPADVVAVVVAEPNRTEVAAEPNRTGGVVVTVVGVDVEAEDGVVVVLGVLEEAVLAVGCMKMPLDGFSNVDGFSKGPLESSGNCKAGLFEPSLIAVWQVPWRPLWKREVEGRAERLSSSRSEVLSVATPKLLVFESAILAVSSVYEKLITAPP